MPLERRRESRVVAVIDTVVVTEQSAFDDAVLRTVLERVNRRFSTALAEPFSPTAADRVEGALADPAHCPSCLSVLRESLAPLVVRAGVGIGAAAPNGGGGRNAFAGARRALALAIRDDGLTRYAGAGEAGDVLLAALCRLVDPLIRARTVKQWEAIAAYRELGHQGAVAEKLGVTRQSVGDRLAAGHRRDVEEADAAVAIYLGYLRGQPPPP